MSRWLESQRLTELFFRYPLRTPHGTFLSRC